jgi:hypothetical protein
MGSESGTQLPRIHADLAPPVRRVARQHVMQIVSLQGIGTVRKISDSIPKWTHTRFKPWILIPAIEREPLSMEESSSGLSQCPHGPEVDTRVRIVKPETDASASLNS